jgi:tRNA U34 5-carboxymethylaminomethyl modifying GTPase MnmE/TrmE
MISLTAERIIRDKVAKKQQKGSKEPTKANKGNDELVATLRKEVEDLKSQRDKQLATKDQQISSKDRQIDHLTKLVDQQQQLQLTTLAENGQLKKHLQKLSRLIEASNSGQKWRVNDKDDKIHKNKTNNSWWHFW